MFATRFQSQPPLLNGNRLVRQCVCVSVTSGVLLVQVYLGVSAEGTSGEKRCRESARAKNKTDTAESYVSITHNPTSQHCRPASRCLGTKKGYEMCVYDSRTDRATNRGRALRSRGRGGREGMRTNVDRARRNGVTVPRRHRRTGNTTVTSADNPGRNAGEQKCWPNGTDFVGLNVGRYVPGKHMQKYGI